MGPGETNPVRIQNQPLKTIFPAIPLCFYPQCQKSCPQFRALQWLHLCPLLAQFYLQPSCAHT